MDAATGEEEWTFTTGHYAMHSSPAVNDGTVYVGSNDGNVYDRRLAAFGGRQWG